MNLNAEAPRKERKMTMARQADQTLFDIALLSLHRGSLLLKSFSAISASLRWVLHLTEMEK